MWIAFLPKTAILSETALCDNQNGVTTFVTPF